MSDSFDFLGLPGIRTTAKTEIEGALIVEAETISPRFPQCCLLSSRVSDGWRAKRRIVSDTQNGGIPAMIHFRVRRAKCKACGKRGIDEMIPHLAKGRNITKRLHAYIVRECYRTTHTKIARAVKLSEGTVRSIVTENLSKGLARHSFTTPRVLGLDEKTILGSFRAVLADIEEHRLIDILDDNGDSLKAFLRTLPAKERVEVLCIDMSSTYQRFAREYLPGVPVVSDRFHVTRRANYAMQKIRAAVASSLDARQRYSMRRSAALFTTRSHDLTAETHERIVRYGQRFPELRDAYWSKERFCQMYEENLTPNEAKRYYQHWISTLPGSVRAVFTKFCTITPTFKDGVFNYFDHPYTSGYVEGMNRVIDEVQAAGRGYSFEVMRGKMLLATKPDPTIFRGSRGLVAKLLEVCQTMFARMTQRTEIGQPA